MKLPSFKRIIVEDFKEQSSWIGRLLFPINSALTELAEAFNKNIDTDNLAADVKEITIKVGANTFPYKFKPSKAQRVTDLSITYAKDVSSTGAVAFATAPFAEWSFDQQGLVSVENITGLTSGQTYRIRLMYWFNPK